MYKPCLKITDLIPLIQEDAGGVEIQINLSEYLRWQKLQREFLELNGRIHEAMQSKG